MYNEGGKVPEHVVSVRFLLLVLGDIVSFAQNPTLLWDYEALKDVKTDLKYRRIKTDCINNADTYLSLLPINIMDKNWSLNDDFYYYATMACYWWPEEVNGKIVYVRHDGKSYAGVNDLDLKKIRKMAERLQYFSLAFFTYKRKYLKAFNRLRYMVY